MKRALPLAIVAILAVAGAWYLMPADTVRAASPVKGDPNMKWTGEKVVKTDEEWKKQLTPDQYKVCRKAQHAREQGEPVGVEQAIDVGVTGEVQRAGDHARRLPVTAKPGERLCRVSG